jgi:hypothetical protein
MLRHVLMSLIVGMVVALVGVDAAAQSKPEGHLVIAFDTSIASTYLDPAEAPGLQTPFVFHYALHLAKDPLDQTDYFQRGAGAFYPPGDAEDGGGGYRLPDDRGQRGLHQRGPEVAAGVGRPCRSLVAGVPGAVGLQISLA